MKKFIILLLFVLPLLASAQTKVFRIPSGGGSGTGMTAAERASLDSIRLAMPKLVRADSGFGLISDAEKALIGQLEQRPIFNRDSVYTKAAKVPSEDITGGTIFTGVVNRSIPAPSASNLHLMYTPVDILVSGVRDALVGTSPSVTYSIRYGSLRSTAVGTIVNARTTTSTVGAAATLTGTTVAIPAGSWIWLEITSVSGTISDFGLTLIYN